MTFDECVPIAQEVLDDLRHRNLPPAVICTVLVMALGNAVGNWTLDGHLDGFLNETVDLLRAHAHGTSMTRDMARANSGPKQ